MKKWLHVFTPIAGVVLTALSPTLQATIAHHPTATGVLAAIAAVINALLPSPISGPTQ